MGRKTKVRLFVSYARANKNLAGKFLRGYREQVAAAKSYEYEFWQDGNILVGEAWHETILEALDNCDLGLILISPALLGSKYISKHELPKFVKHTAKPFIPIMLQTVDFERMDLKGLKKYQIFRLERATFRAPKSYGDCTGIQRDHYVQALFREVDKRLDKLFGRKGA